MEILTRALDYVSITLLWFMFMSTSAAAPRGHNHQHRHDAHVHGSKFGPGGAGTGLFFKNGNGNGINRDFDLFWFRPSQSVYNQTTASIATGYQGTEAAPLNTPTSVPYVHVNGSLSHQPGPMDEPRRTAYSSDYVVQPHERVHHTDQALASSGTPNTHYAVTMISVAPWASSATPASEATRSFNEGKVVQSTSSNVMTAVALLPSPLSEGVQLDAETSSHYTMSSTTAGATLFLPSLAGSEDPPQPIFGQLVADFPAAQFSSGRPVLHTYRQSEVLGSNGAHTSDSALADSPATVLSSSMSLESSTTAMSRIPPMTKTVTDSDALSSFAEQAPTATHSSGLLTPSLASETSIAPQASEVYVQSDDYASQLSGADRSSSKDPASTLPTWFTAPLSSRAVSPPSITYAEGSSIIIPEVLSRHLHGASLNEPTSQYVKLETPPTPQLPEDLLTVGINNDLSTSYGLAADTGIIPIDESTVPLVSDLKARPHISRDGGKGGYLNGQKLFMFCDTGSYTSPTPEKMGDFLGFVSSSVAIDVEMRGAYGEPLVLEDGIGEWSDDMGRMRGFSPLTAGEQSYNLIMQGQGQRYAIWPESSIIPYNQTHALLYAPIVYVEVDMSTRKAVFTYAGSTLLSVTAESGFGPRADRIVDMIFHKDEVEWGTVAGFRSYGPAGPGGNDGKVYVFGKVQWGMLLGRVDAAHIADRAWYEYWDGAHWTPEMPDHTSTAYFFPGAVMDGDMIYSPAHLTFIFVYLNPFIDNTFYFRYLKADAAIRPADAPGGDASSDFAENLVKYEWSEEQVLYRAEDVPAGKYIYAGAVHQGYFDQDDISNGGKKMLLSWTVPTGENPASMENEYVHVTAGIEFV